MFNVPTISKFKYLQDFFFEKKRIITFFKYSFIAFYYSCTHTILNHGIRNRNKIKAKNIQNSTFANLIKYIIFCCGFCVNNGEGNYGCDGFVYIC